MSKVALTGSTGMIGFHMKELLKNKNIPFVDVTRKIWDLSVWKSDEELDSIFKDVNCIFHFAALIPKQEESTQLLFDCNVRACLNIAQWAQKREKSIVFLSSASVYKNPQKPSIEESDEKVISGLGGFYGYSKLLAENIFDHFKEQGLKITILRPSSVYGFKLASNQLVSIFLNKVMNKETIDLTEPNNKVNFVHAMDVSKAAVLAYESKSYGVFNISNNELNSIEELANYCQVTVKKGNINKYNDIKNPFKRFDLNCKKAETAFGFQAKVDLKKGLKSMFEEKTLVFDNEGNK
jgi:nucleoside-diphosphate-sugar epimerase